MPTRPLSHTERQRRTPGVHFAERKIVDPFYKTANWQRLRRIVLQRDPYCVECLKEHRFVESSHVDHVIGRDVRPDLERDLDNLQGLCASCHSSKTAREDGGFGRAPSH